jgi:phenylalanyl-tRNA synthetase beta chain
MKFPYRMLCDFVETPLNAEEVGNLLTMAGFELEGISEADGDSVLDIKVMSNRGDGLSVFGLAREVLAKDTDSRPTALYERARRRFPLGDEDQPTAASVRIETPECTRYACRIFNDVRNGESPAWIQLRLRQAGMRPISLLVDLANYVMLEIGQPLHTFDFKMLRGGGIIVRKATTGEKLTTLDGVNHELRGDQMMICDLERPVAAAGIMGGAETEVSASTTRVLLESAHFENRSIRRTRKQLGLNTEASYRFERSVDPDGVVAALNRFAELLAAADSGGMQEPGVTDVYPAPQSTRRIRVSHAKAELLLGVTFSPTEAAGYLTRLGFEVEGNGEPFDVTPPTWRPDVVREEDVIEEIGRVHGFDLIPERLPQGTTLRGGTQGFLRQIDELREKVVRAGYIQILSHTLRDLHPLDDGGDRIGPRQPAGPDTAYLRNSLMPGLADAFRRNGARDLHLFEIGKVFAKGDGDDGAPVIERRCLAIMSQGHLYPSARPKEQPPHADFFSLKACLGAALPTLEFLSSPPGNEDPRFHPGRFALLREGPSGKMCGRMGQVHPNVAAEAGIPADTCMAEIDLDALQGVEGNLHYRPVSRNPAVRRDITVGISKSVLYVQLEGALRNACGEVLEKLWLADLYEGPGVAEGEHAITFALQLRKFGENFTDEEANRVRDAGVEALVALGAKQR